MKIEYGEYKGAKTVTLNNNRGMAVTLCAAGAGIMSIKVPDRDGTPREVTKLGKNGYATDFHGLTIGRTSGRISNAEFSIGDKTAHLQKNNFGVDNLHAGRSGLFSRLFDMRVTESINRAEVEFTYFSPDGEGGYFGNADIRIIYYAYNDKNVLGINFCAVPDCATLFNMTNHVYFNMSGDLREPFSEQLMFINASRYGVLNERLVLQEVVPVTPPFDFTTPRKAITTLNDESVQRYSHGYDHPFFLDARGLDITACSLHSETSGIRLNVKTTYPCVVVYGDNFAGNMGVCFECQYNPDGIHMSPHDCGIATPDDPYNETTEFWFDIE